ncbi:LPD38 domain-containing protein [Cohnella sp. GbtcB17]|uniref:LPD38 domain-containing protein n=1 Tax=Cohnella sp. GbtcB17 TaxID=2824762 RepID=UPI001C2FC401|nr:LPD38 domain-containing protein [Cohnella sp. GbtcB17]
MSEFDNVRRRAQGAAARQSVKDRLAGTVSPSAAPASEYDSIRNRSVAPPDPVAVTVPSANPMSAPTTVTPIDFMHAQQAAIVNPTFGVTPQAKPTAQAAPSNDPGAKELAVRDASRAGGPKLLQKFGHAVDKFLLTTKPGRFITGFNRGAEETLTGVQSASPDVGGKGAYIAGSLIGGAAINPAALEQSLVKGGYDLAAGALSTRLGSKAVGKLGQVIEGAPGISAQTAQRLAETGARGAIAGAYQNVGLSAAAGHTSAQELGEAAALGGALGGVGDAAVSGLASVLRRYRGSASNPETIDKILALPEPRTRGQVNGAETPDVINVPESGPRGLPEPSAEEAARWRNINESQVEVAAIDNELRALESRYQQAVNDQYKFLKQSMADRGGVEQGALLRDEAGDVTGRLGRQSNNPEWYQEFFRTNGRAPNNKELYALAKQHVDEGFTDGGQQLPSWKAENGYDETVAALQQVKGQLEQFQREAAPATAQAAAPISTPMRAPGVEPIPGTGRTGVEVAAPVAEPIPVSSPSVEPAVPNQLAPDPGPLGFAANAKGGKFTNPADTRTYIETKTTREPIDISGMADEFYRRNVDNLQRINQLDKYVESITGKPLPADQRAYVQALNTRGNDVIAKHILTEQLVDAKGNVIGEPLKDITKQIPRRSYTNFLDYLIARHAETRMAPGRDERVYDPRTGMTLEKVADKIRMYQDTYPEFEGIAKQLYEWNDKLGQAWLVDTGIITPETWKAWKEANPYWVPNKRYFSKLEQSGRPPGKARRGFSGQGSPVKSYSPTGSERPIIDPIESIIEYVDKYVKTAKRNEVMQTVIQHLNNEPEALQGFAELVPENQNMHQSSIAAMNKLIKDEGIETLLEKLDGEFEAAYNKNQKERVAGRGNIVTGMIAGEPVQVQVNDIPLLEALANLSPQTSNAVVEAARKVTNAMKLLTTGVNPVFSLTRNIWRDIPTAYIFSKTTNNPFTFAWDLLDGVVSTFGNKELYQRYKAVGGGHSSPVAADRNLLSQAKRELLPQNKKGMGLIPRAYGALENLSNVIESAPRLGEFKRVTQAGGDSYASRQEGLFLANDLTTNFKRKGSTIKDADAFLPYLNAAVQGLDKTIRAFKDNPGSVSAKAFLAITIPTIVLYAINHKRKDYQELSNYTKDNFFLIPTGDKQFIKIPRPRELGIPFGALLERTMRAWADEDPESFRDFSDTVTTAFSPPGIPAKELAKGDFMGAAIAPVRDTVLGPLVDVASNENFAGAAIVPQYLEGVSPRLQFDANTSEVGKKIGNILNVSPKQVDHLIRSYTGVIGQLGLPASSTGATIGETLGKQVTADSVFSNDASGKFYELKDKLDTKYNDIKATGNVPEGYNDGLRKYMNSAADQISDVSKAIRAVDKMIMSSGQKKEKKRELTALRNQIAQEAYEKVRDVMKQK